MLSRGVRTDKIQLGDAVLLNEGGERLAGQGIAFGLRKDMVGYDVQFRHELRAARAGLEGPRPRRQIVVLDISVPQFVLRCPVDRLVDVFDDLPVVFRDAILQVDHDHCAVFHTISSCADNIMPIYI